eukprot:5326112-Ditylum_brightwellii.AAC.1
MHAAYAAFHLTWKDTPVPSPTNDAIVLPDVFAVSALPLTQSLDASAVSVLPAINDAIVPSDASAASDPPSIQPLYAFV